MNIYQLKLKDNEIMQDFCFKKLDEISCQEVIYYKQLKEVGHICDRNLINKYLGNCKIEKDFYKYFLYLLKIEYAELEKQAKGNINQISVC